MLIDSNAGYSEAAGQEIEQSAKNYLAWLDALKHNRHRRTFELLHILLLFQQRSELGYVDRTLSPISFTNSISIYFRYCSKSLSNVNIKKLLL